MASDGIRVLEVRIGRRSARLRASDTELRAHLDGRLAGFELGKRYGVVVTYHDDRSGRTDSFRFPEVLRKAALTVCDAAAPC